MALLQSLFRSARRMGRKRISTGSQSRQRVARLGSNVGFERFEDRLLFATYDLEIDGGGTEDATTTTYAPMKFAELEVANPPYTDPHGKDVWGLKVQNWQSIQDLGNDHTIVVTISVGGSATQNVDYDLFFKPKPRFAAPDYPTDPTLAWQDVTGNSVTLPQGSGGYGTFYIKPRADSVVEGNESVRLKLISAGTDTIDSILYSGRGEITDSQPVENEIRDAADDHHGPGGGQSDCGCGTLMGVEQDEGPLTGSIGTHMNLGCLNMNHWNGTHTDPTISLKGYLPFFNNASAVVVEAKLEIAGNAVGTPVYIDYDSAGADGTAAANAKISLALQGRLPLTLASGVHNWTVKLRYLSGGNYLQRNGVVIEDTVTGERPFVNRQSSPYGNGWWIDGFDQLKSTGAGRLLITGSGDAHYFKSRALTQAEQNAGILEAFDRPFGEPGFSKLEKINDATLGLVYRLTDKHGNKLVFDTSTAGFLKFRYDAQGNAIEYHNDGTNYDWFQDKEHGQINLTYTSGKLSGVTDGSGRTTQVKIESGLLKLITAAPVGAQGPQTSFDYYAADNLASGQVQDYIKTVREHNVFVDPATFISSNPAHPKDHVRAIVYDHGRGLMEIKDEFDKSSTEYRGMQPNRILNERPSVNSGTASIPGLFSIINTAVEQGGSGLLFDTFIGGGLKGHRIERVEVNGNPTLLEETKFRTDNLGQYILWEEQHGTTMMTRNSEGLIDKVIDFDPDGALGPLGQVETLFTYDARGNKLTEARRLASSPFTVLETHSWEYDATFGQVTKHVDPLGRATKYVIDSSGNVLSMTQVVDQDDSTTGGFNDVVTKYTYTSGLSVNLPPLGLIETETDPLGRTTKYEYFANGLVKKVTYAAGTVDEASVQYTYDANKNMDMQTDELGQITDYDYNAQNQLIKITEPDPDLVPGGTNGPLTSPITLHEYDLAGNRVKSTDPLTRVTRWVYDAAGQPLYEILPRPESSSVTPQIIDDGPNGGGFATTQTWTSLATGHGGDSRYLGAGGAGNATWTFSGLDPAKNYEVFGTWSVDATNNATDAPFVITNSSSVSQTVKINQRFAPVPDAVDVGSNWQQLGVYSGTSSLTIALTSSTTGRVVADAVRIIEVGPTVKYGYDAQGNMTRQTDARGNTTEHLYDHHGRQTTVVLPDADGKGNPTTFTDYYDDGSVKQQTDPMGKSMLYEYDELGRTIKITAPDPDDGLNLKSPVTVYTYNAAGEMTTMVQTDAGSTFSTTTRYEYDYLGRQTMVILPLADPSAVAQDVVKNDVSGQASFAPNDVAWTLASGGYGGQNHYHPATTQTNVIVEWSFTLTAGKTYEILATWVPDSANATNALYEIRASNSNLKGTSQANQQYAPSDVTGLGVTWERLMLYKPETNDIYKVWLRGNANGRVNADAVRVVEVGAVNKTLYNKAGNVVSTVNPQNVETLSEYDARDRLVASYQPPAGNQLRVGPSDPNSAPAGWTEYSHPEALSGSYLLAESATAPANWAMHLPGGHAGHSYAVMATWAPDVRNKSDAYFYVDQAGFGSIWAGAVNQQLRPADYQDSSGRMWDILTVFTSQVEAATTLNVTGDIGAQADGMMVIEVAPGWIKNVNDKASQVTSSIDLRGQTTTFQYDLLGRQTVVTLPDPDGPSNPQISPQTEYVYDKNGNVLQEKVRLTAGASPTYLTTYHSYDNLNRRIVTTDANFDSTTFQYDANGNMTRLTDAMGNDTTYVFDALNRVTSDTTEIPNNTRTFEYDKASRLTKQTNRDLRYIEHFYDNLGRETSEVWRSSAGVLQQTLTFTYDNQGRLVDAKDLDSSANLRSGYNYTYDTLSQPLQTTATITGLGVNVTTNEVWDILGQRTELRATVGATADFKNNYTFDNLGRITQITQQDVTGGRTVADKRVVYNYNAAGDVLNMGRHSHLTSQSLIIASQYGRDAVGRVTSSQHFKNSQLAAYTSTFDAASRLTTSSRITNGAIGITETASYTNDNTGQLTGVSRSGAAPATETYSYDGAGNRTGATGVAYINNPNNRIHRDGAYQYEYDAEGNIIQRWWLADSDARIDYTYDHRNRLVTMKQYDANNTLLKDISLQYDVFNRRVSKTVNTTASTYFVYDTDDVVLALTSTGAMGRRYLHGPAVDEILADEEANNLVQWALKDQFYNVRDLVDHAGGHYNHLDYNTFGLVTYELRPQSQGHLGHAYGFQSRERDLDLDLNYHRNRYYNQNIGRWMSEDPIGFAGGDVNLNRFVGNSPTTRIDPTGTDFITVQTFSIGGIGGHYSLNYWSQTDDRIAPRRRWFDIKEGGYDSAPSLCATRTARVELWRDPAYTARATRNVLTLLFTIEEQETMLDVAVSVIEFDAMERKDVKIYPVFHGSDEDAKKKWDAIVANAKTYKFAEQEVDVANNRFPNWPDSYYSALGTNSNSFVWEMLRRADLPKPPGNGYWHPGNDPPVRNRPADKWIFRDPPRVSD
ncbi:MAG: RHS repeat-associated core domain-containing protein [Pirellulales bacterium]